MGSYQTMMDMFMLPLSGAELVLGVQWLQTLGPILTDFTRLTMRFMKDDEVVQLTGVPRRSADEASLHQLRHLASTYAIDTLLRFHFNGPSPDEAIPEQIPPEIVPILQQFRSIFEEPETLPPSRTIDHQIPLKEGADSVNVRPYRYPHFQKQEIEAQITYMLQ